jgi:hypothetical protein
MSVIVRNKGSDTFTVNGEDVAAGEAHAAEPGSLLIDGAKLCEIENQTEGSLTMTVGDIEDGGTQMEISPGATVSVNGPLPVHVEETPHAG